MTDVEIAAWTFGICAVVALLVSLALWQVTKR